MNCPVIIRALEARSAVPDTRFAAFTAGVDAGGLALLSEPLTSLQARDGEIRIVLSSGRDTTEAAGALAPAGGGLTVDVAPGTPGTNVYVLEDGDGTWRAYLGAAPLTFTGLTTAAPGVVLDMRQDSDAARALLEAQTRTADAAKARSVTATPLLDLLQPVIDKIENKQARDHNQVAPESPPRGTAVLARDTAVRGPPTGSVELDRLTGGLQPGDLWVVTGRSGVGKSVFALGLARHAAVRSRATTALLAGRGSNVDAATMLLSAEAQVSLHDLWHGGLDDDDWGRLARQMGEIAEAPLLLHTVDLAADAPRRTARERVAQARDVAGRHEAALLIVDDFPPTITTDELPELKHLAMALGLCVVAVADEGTRLPLLLTERAAGQVADVVVRMDREHEMTAGPESARLGQVDLRVLRHRRGPTAVITMAFQPHYARLAEMPTDGDPDPTA